MKFAMLTLLGFVQQAQASPIEICGYVVWSNQLSYVSGEKSLIFYPDQKNPAARYASYRLLPASNDVASDLGRIVAQRRPTCVKGDANERGQISVLRATNTGKETYGY